MSEKNNPSLIKIYFDQNLFLEGYVFDLFSRLSDQSIKISEGADEFFQIVEKPERSDLIFIPVPLSELVRNGKGRESIQIHVETGRAFSKKVFVVSDADLIFDPGFEEVIILTPGAYRSLPNQIALPALLSTDPYNKWLGGDWKALENPSNFRVGFCGQATSHKLKFIKDQFQYFQLIFKKFLGDNTYLYIPNFFAASERSRILKHLEESPLIETDFLKRERYKGGAKSHSDLQRLEAEFFKNISDNLFTVCIRGFGNYSLRFFQTLAMGRIPIVIETDSVLPFESQIAYEEICIQIPYKSRFKSDLLIRKFLIDKSPDDLVKIQQKCRETWVEFFNKPSYFKALGVELGNYLII